MPYERADLISKPVQVTTNLSRPLWDLAKNKGIKWCVAIAHGIRVLTNPNLDPTNLKKEIEKMSAFIRTLSDRIYNLRKENKELRKLARKNRSKKTKNVLRKSTSNKRGKKSKIQTSKRSRSDV